MNFLVWIKNKLSILVKFEAWNKNDERKTYDELCGYFLTGDLTVFNKMPSMLFSDDLLR